MSTVTYTDAVPTSFELTASSSGYVPSSASGPSSIASTIVSSYTDANPTSSKPSSIGMVILGTVAAMLTTLLIALDDCGAIDLVARVPHHDPVIDRQNRIKLISIITHFPVVVTLFFLVQSLAART
ncbi:hypothetical protein K504DRAFT_458854 [Pleomassaria siparia CBS 279.74]|uniref:Transmembrane protein n=1 Tax=Pleomassaria siparia CBS 279.74 TaxID=1314801 RepID=A0A6G1K4M9_9PLEO|nr:hypothetical protein K504DRAFT_458854 [Pleomassaria siparia CBS 279.74]